MRESWASRRFRWLFNIYPAYRGVGGRVEMISADFREVRVRVGLSLRTRNYVGTIFGGSLYGAVDPVYMLMLIHVLGPEYVVWDKAAAIQFLKPGRSTLRATFRLDEEEIATIRALAAGGAPVIRHYQVELVDREEVPHCIVEKTIYIRKKKQSGSS